MDLTRRLRGKVIESLLTNGHLLQLRTSDGAEMHIAWADDEGRALKGQPLCVHHGVRLIAAGLHDLINLPSATKELRP